VGERGRLTLDLSLAGARVHADQSQLELVLFELVLNASDAIGEHGAISITTRRKIVDEAGPGIPSSVPNGDYAEIVVRDSGSATSEAGYALGFDSSYTTTGEHGHIGLGLAMAYGLVQQLGGYVVVSSPPPSGTEVCIFLRAIHATEVDESPAVDPQTLIGNETILVVEDEQPVRNVVTRGLRAHGYNVIEAKHGEDALAVAEAYGAPIHLVLSDVVMPQMDGRALFERMRTWYPRIRFLFVSGYTRGVIAEEELSGSATGFLAKPFRIEELCVQVRRLLDHAR
jgi:CheY-like chemotaxis protein/anti-sigma regulatory factor (Ser/Thr protein kinase)